MNFDVVLVILLSHCMFSGCTLAIQSCHSSNKKYTDIDGQCYWCLGGADLSVGEKSCEVDSGSVFSVRSLDHASMIKDQFNISVTTEVFIGAIFNDVNGSQYEWLSAPGTHSELLSNLSAQGIGNTSVACLSVGKEIKAVDCDKQMSVTICMRDISPDCPCSSEQTTDSSDTTLPLMYETTTTVTKTISNTNKTTTHSPNTAKLAISSEKQTKTNTASSYVQTLKPNSSVDKTTSPTVKTQTSQFVSNTNPAHLNVTDAALDANQNISSGAHSDKPILGITPSSQQIAHGLTSLQPSVHQNDKVTTDQNAADADLSNNHIDPADNTSTKLDLSEKIDHVPGASGAISIDELMARVISQSNLTKTVGNSTGTDAKTPNFPAGRYCKDKEDDIKGVTNAHLGVLVTNFSNVLDHVLGHKTGHTSKKPCIPRINQGNSGDTDDKKHPNVDFKDQVKDVKFQVSPNLDNIPPWRGDPGLIPYGDDHQMFGILRNTSRELDELQETQDVTNTTFERLSGTIENVVSHDRIPHVSEHLKDTLLADILITAEKLFTQITSTLERILIQSETLEVDSKVIEVSQDNNDSHIAVKSTAKQTVRLSKDIIEDANADTRVSTIEYKKLDAIMASSDSHVSSHVMSVSIQRVMGNTTKTIDVKGTKGAVILVLETFVIPDKQEDRRLCTFWDFASRNWSSTGCTLLDENATHTTCTCDHLTNFAVLVMYLESEKISVQSQQALLTLTTVGCSLSIACLAMTLIAFTYLRMLGNEKILIHFNLSLALVLAQIVFVSSSDAHTNPVACKVVAILLHFFFMASFTWMLVEGVALYLLCTKGFMNHRDMRLKYFLLGWGVPAIIVLVSLAAKFPNYGHGPQYSCWLSIQDGLIWAFLGPMLAIVVLNMFVMGLVVRKFLTLKAVAQKSEVAKLRGSLRAMMTLLPLLGLTWLLSLLVPFSVVFHYFFVIINTLQGMCIFFLHCICNDELRKKFQAKRRRWSSPTRTGSDSDTRYTARRKTGV